MDQKIWSAKIRGWNQSPEAGYKGSDLNMRQPPLSPPFHTVLSPQLRWNYPPYLFRRYHVLLPKERNYYYRILPPILTTIIC
eukprot:8934479-Ditylum_brightwellii.AAC.1